MLLSQSQFLAEWKTVVYPVDYRCNYKARGLEFWVKHQIAHFVNPKKIVEIGVRSGYSAWAMLKAVPEAKFVGFDDYKPGYGVPEPGVKCLSEEFKKWARKILSGFNAQVVVQDTQAPGFLPPPADLYNVDGDHKKVCAFRDIVNCAKAGSDKSVIIVHDFITLPVRQAVLEAAAVCNLTVCEVCELVNSNAVLVHGSFPSWMSKVSISRSGVLIKQR